MLKSSTFVAKCVQAAKRPSIRLTSRAASSVRHRRILVMFDPFFLSPYLTLTAIFFVMHVACYMCLILRCRQTGTRVTGFGSFTAVSSFAIATAFVSATALLSTEFFSVGVSCENGPIPVWGEPGTNRERTFLAVKPDGVQRGLVGDIIARFEKRGYKLVGLKMVWPSQEMAEKHYVDLASKPFYKGLCKFFSSGPIVCMCWEGKDIIRQGRQMLGETQPLASKPGSIRGDYSIDLGRNICHGSDSPESAKHELQMWFPEGVNDWGKSIDSWVYE